MESQTDIDMRRIIIVIVIVVSPVVNWAQSIQIDKALGEQNAQMVEAQMGIYKDRNKTEYIRKVGKRLVKELDQPLFEYQFFLVPELAPNAFALPGGYIYVTTGLLAILKTEDELACILGHEIIHSNNRHAVRKMKRSVLPKLLEVPGNLLGAFNEDLGAVFNAPIVMSNTLLFASYSREFETEADKQGILLAAKAGYDPKALISALNRLSKSVEIATGVKEQNSYFNDHPITAERTKTINNELNKIRWNPSKSISSNFLSEIDKTIFGDDPANGVIQNQVFLHPNLNLHIEFPKEWSIENQPSNVSAYHSSKQAAIIFSTQNPKLSPKEAAKEFLKDLQPEYASKLVKQEVYKINGKEGYLITFIDKSSKVDMYGYVLWLPHEGNLLQLIGIAPLKFEPQLIETAQSIRILNKEERQSIRINYLEIVQAEQGESLAALSKRQKNILNAKLTGVINDIEKNASLRKDDLIKIVKSYPYSP